MAKPGHSLRSKRFKNTMTGPVGILYQVVDGIASASKEVAIPKFCSSIRRMPRTRHRVVTRVPFSRGGCGRTVNMGRLFKRGKCDALRHGDYHPSFSMYNV